MISQSFYRGRAEQHLISHQSSVISHQSSPSLPLKLDTSGQSMMMEEDEDEQKIIKLLQNKFLEIMACLYRQGFLDAQFVQLQKLQDESSPDFVLEVVSLFFEDSEKLLNNLTASLQLQVVDFKQVDAFVHQLKGSSSSIGAQRVKNACVSFRNCCEEKNLQGCMTCLEHLKNEYFLVKDHLESLCKLERQILAVGGKVPVLP